MLHFRSEAHLERWLGNRGLTRGGTMTLEQCRRLGIAWYGDKASPTWRRKTLDEAHATFAAIGLTGDFWRLA